MSLHRRDFFRSSTAGILGVLGAGHLLAEPPQPSRGESKNPFLTGNFAPVREEVTVDDLKVLGKLPPELDGMYVRCLLYTSLAISIPKKVLAIDGDKPHV